MAPDPLDRLLALVERIKPFGAQADAILEMKDCAARLRLRDYRRTNPEITAMWHHVRRENDEYACSCGRRWPMEDGEEHP